MKSFTEKVRDVVRDIPKGRVMTYQEVAAKAGNPKAYRAVANIMAANYDLEIPCHRVIRSDLPAPRPDVYYVYAILCNNEAIYIGQTNDIQKRWREHSEGSAAEYTKRYGVKKLIHYEKFNSREAAVEREKALKTGFGRKWLKREWEAGRTRQAGGDLGGYNRGGVKKKRAILQSEGVIL